MNRYVVYTEVWTNGEARSEIESKQRVAETESGNVGIEEEQPKAGQDQHVQEKQLTRRKTE